MSGASLFSRHDKVSILENGVWTRGTVIAATIDGVDVVTIKHHYRLTNRQARELYVMGPSKLDQKLGGARG